MEKQINSILTERIITLSKLYLETVIKSNNNLCKVSTLMEMKIPFYLFSKINKQNKLLSELALESRKYSNQLQRLECKQDEANLIKMKLNIH